MILFCLYLVKFLKIKKVKKRIIRMASSDFEDGGGFFIYRFVKRVRFIEFVDFEII